jgi:hypothetical protein
MVNVFILNLLVCSARFAVITSITLKCLKGKPILNKIDEGEGQAMVRLGTALGSQLLSVQVGAGTAEGPTYARPEGNAP